MLVGACGDPTSVESTGDEAVVATDPGAVASLPDSSSAVALNGVRVCTDAPFLGSAGGKEPPEDVAFVVTPWVDAHPDLFAGVWWDREAGEFVFAAIDAEQSSALIEQEFPGDLAYRVEVVPHSASALEVLQQRVVTLNELGIYAGSGHRVWDGLLEVDLPILDEPSLGAVREVFAGDLDAICVTGADPATVPPDGPQPTSGHGWRLLADQTQRGEPYSVHIAVNSAEYESMWASLALDGEPPPVDFATEIVIHFGAVYGGSCPEIRLDGVNFDLDRSLVTAAVVQLGGNRVCTADANSRAYVVAVDKSSLPGVPFVVSLKPDCTYSAHLDVTNLDGTPSPIPALSEVDRAQILAAAAIARLTTGAPRSTRLTSSTSSATPHRRALSTSTPAFHSPTSNETASAKRSAPAACDSCRCQPSTNSFRPRAMRCSASPSPLSSMEDSPSPRLFGVPVSAEPAGRMRLSAPMPQPG